MGDKTIKALVEIGQWLQGKDYIFETGSPDTHAIVNGRATNEKSRTIRDVFGWSRAFDSALLPAEVLNYLSHADALETVDGALRSKVRFSTDGNNIYAHSAFPTIENDAVFFGPDTYRFANLIRRECAKLSHAVETVVDVGCGCGVGGIVASQAIPTAHIVLGDINRKALKYAEANATLAGLPRYSCIESDVLSGIASSVDLIISNPPYMIDAQARAYRDGGGEYGADLSLRILRESLDYLSPQGKVIIYTGSAIVDGIDTFQVSAKSLLNGTTFFYRYEQIDPDVFGSELTQPGYENVERIAVVALVASRANC